MPATADVSPFNTPSGNIECSIGEDFGGTLDLRCTIYERAGPPAMPKPAGCKASSGHTFILLNRGPVQMECRDPGRQSDATGVDVANYGVKADWGDIECMSATSGLECRNADGHGFTLSRKSQTVY